MFLSQLKIATAIVVLTGLTAWGGFGAYRAWADKPANAESQLPVLQNSTKPADQDSAKKSVQDVAKTLEGRWTTKVDVGDQSITVRMEFQNENNKWKGTVRLSKDKTYELEKIQVTGAKVSFDCEADEAALSFSGELKDGAISGKVEMLTKKEGLMEGTFSMTRR
jgi:hypothetical protein